MFSELLATKAPTLIVGLALSQSLRLWCCVFWLVCTVSGHVRCMAARYLMRGVVVAAAAQSMVTWHQSQAATEVLTGHSLHDCRVWCHWWLFQER